MRLSGGGDLAVEGWVGCGEDDFSGAALAGDEDANAFKHLGRRAGAFGKEDVGTAGTVVCGDGSGDDHCGQGWVKLLGAADKFVAVHLRHEQIAEEQIDGAGQGVGDGLDGVLGSGESDYAVTTGFEEEGSDGEDLFIVIDTEDDLLGTHGYSVLPGGIADRLQNRVGRWPGGLGPKRRVCWLARVPKGGVMFSPATHAGGSLGGLGAARVGLDRMNLARSPRLQGQSSPVCSVRRQLPGRRLSLCSNDRPRVRERAGSDAGCHTEFLEHVRPKILKASGPAGPKAMGSRKWPKGWIKRLRLQLETVRKGRPRLRAGGFSLKSNCVKNRNVAFV